MPTGTIIENPEKSSSKTVRVTALAHYEHDKAIYTGSRNFQFDGFKTQIAEMISLANEAVKSKDPIDHYVISWQEGEQPTPKQIEECVDILMEELGLKGCQVLYGLHNDTANGHLHFVANRVDPETGKVRRVNNGFNVDAIQRAAAIIGHRQGWAAVPNTRFEVLENGECVRVKEVDDLPARPNKKTLDMENRTGVKSAKSIAIEEAAPIIQNATSWRQLHAELGVKGFRYEREGSGAYIYIGETRIKASDASRGKTSLPAVQKRLGIYEPATQKEPNVYYTHEPIADYSDVPRPLTEKRLSRLSERRLVQNDQGEVSDSVLQDIPRDNRSGDGSVRRIPAAADNSRIRNGEPGGDSGFPARAGLRESGQRPGGVPDVNPAGNRDSGLVKEPAPDLTIRPVNKMPPDQVDLHLQYALTKQNFEAARAREKIEMQRRHDAERASLRVMQKAERDSVLGGDWKGVGTQKNVLSSFIKSRQAGAKQDLKDKHKAERAEYSRKFGKLPTYEAWLRWMKRPELAEQWRYRATEPAKIVGDGEIAAQKRDIRAFTPEIVGATVHYSRGGEEIGFVDRGRQVDVYDWQDRDTILAALQLSAEKWGSFSVFGHDQYIAMCVRLAAEHGFKIKNPELQERIEVERVKIRQERNQAMKSPQAEQFKRYHAAVNADRYRVTSIKMHADGTKKTFILDKRDGVTKGFTPAELVQRIPEMVRIERKGENVYFTPMSDAKHHISVDDLSRETLDALVRDGFKPAVVIESSPGNFQAIITIAKLGTPHDADVGNRLTKLLNEKYGDPKLSGAIRPHRAPGFTNRKPKHQATDGSYPEVHLRKAERRECTKSAALAVVLNQTYEAQEVAKKARQPAPIDPTGIDTSRIATTALKNAILAYHLHRPDILARQAGEIDLSRVDSMIAVRMRLTGHDEAAIRACILECAAAAHPDPKAHDWPNYAKRTAAYAFSQKAEQQLPGLQRYRGQWRKKEAEAQARRDQVRIPEPVPAPSPAVEAPPIPPAPPLQREPLQAPELPPVLPPVDSDDEGGVGTKPP